MKKTVVAVLFGGVSSEHEVSRMSASSVLENLDREKYDVLPVGIQKDGTWHLYTGPLADIAGGAWQRHPDNVPVALCPGSGRRGLVAFEGAAVREIPVDVVFPVLHGKNVEDGTVQGLLELAGLALRGAAACWAAPCAWIRSSPTR